jgi:hypothetical protein
MFFSIQTFFFFLIATFFNVEYSDWSTTTVYFCSSISEFVVIAGVYCCILELPNTKDYGGEGCMKNKTGHYMFEVFTHYSCNRLHISDGISF